MLSFANAKNNLRSKTTANANAKKYVHGKKGAADYIFMPDIRLPERKNGSFAVHLKHFSKYPIFIFRHLWHIISVTKRERSLLVRPATPDRTIVEGFLSFSATRAQKGVYHDEYLK